MSGSSQPSRRAFLTGKERPREDSPPRDPEHDLNQAPVGLAFPQTHLLTVSRRAMACSFEIYLPARRASNATRAAMEALDLVEALETQMTVYRETSEILSINATAPVVATPVEPRLFGLLELAQEISEQTQGAFDITTGPLSKAWGFFRRERRLPSSEELSQSLRRVGFRNIELNRADHTVRFHRHDLEIQLNGIGKGYALDRAAETLDEWGVSDALMHGGHSSVVARGSNPNESEGGWRIGIRHPRRPQRRLGELLLRDRAAGTSGSGTQYFHHQGRRYGHLIDPRTGMPAEGIVSATVVTASGAEADALATALVVMGPQRAEAFCRQRPHIGALLVLPGAAGNPIETRVLNLQEQWRPISDGGHDANR